MNDLSLKMALDGALDALRTIASDPNLDTEDHIVALVAAQTVTIKSLNSYVNSLEKRLNKLEGKTRY